MHDTSLSSDFAFWATVCETVRPMLSDHCVCLSVLFCLPYVTLVYCGQTAEWINMKLGRQLGPGQIVLDGDHGSHSQKKAEPPIFGPCLLWLDGWMDEDAT